MTPGQYANPHQTMAVPSTIAIFDMDICQCFQSQLAYRERIELIRWVRSVPRPPMQISVQIELETQRPAGWTLTTYSDPNGKPKTGRLDLTLHTPRPEQETQRPTGWTSTPTPT